MQEEIDTILITSEEAGERLDKVLADRFKDVQSRTYFQGLIEMERVLVNGASAKKRQKLEVGDEVEINFLFTPEISIVPEPIPLTILYEDDDLIVVDKPAGMVVHPAQGNWSGTFVNALIYHCQNLDLPLSDFPRPGIVHRLDKDTSGVMVAAKKAKIQQRLIEMFAAREVKKEYLAICVGNPGECFMREAIGRHPIRRKEMAVVEEKGRPAVTRCKTEVFDGKLSVVSLYPETGRTHQLRVHLRHRGTPILGDQVYGRAQLNQKYGAERQLLHARRLSFSHPATGKILTIEAPIPGDMTPFIESITQRTK